MQKKWNDYWKQMATTDDELDALLESGALSTVTISKARKFISAWNKLKKQADELDQFITPVEPIQVTIPFHSPEFAELWKRWKEYLQEQHGEGVRSRAELSALEHLEKLSKNDENKASAILRYAMANRYRNFFAIDEKDNNQPPKEATAKKSDWD